MTTRRAHALALWLLGAASALPGAAAAQSFGPQPQQYLLTTDVFDARALWVQPAAMVKRRESSVSGLLTVNRTGTLTVGQYGLTLASGGLGLGWQHDRLQGRAHSDAFVVGLAGGSPHLSVGADRRWHRGTRTRDGAWDIGGRYQAGPQIELSLVWRDIGSPVIDRDSLQADTIHTTLVPGAAIQLFHAHLQVGAEWEILSGNWSTSAVRAGATVALPANLALGVRAAFTNKLSSQSLAVSVSWHGTGSRVAAYNASARAPDVDRVGLWGAAVSDPLQPRRRRFGR